MNTSSYNELMKELREEYLEGFDAKYKTLRLFFNEQDWYSLELEYHKLKGTGATYGIPEVTDLCLHLEGLCRENKSIENETLELSIELLEEIRKKYTIKNNYELKEDPKFKKILSLRGLSQ